MFEFLQNAKSSKIQNRLVRYYIVFAVFTVTLITYLTYTQAARSLRLTVEDKLNTVAALKEDSLDHWVDEQQGAAVFLASLPELRALAGKMLNPESPRSQQNVAREELTQLVTLIAQRATEYRDIQILDLNGNIIVSVAPAYIGASQADQPFFEEGQQRTAIQHFYESDLFDDTTLTIATPLFDAENKRVGVFALHFNMKRADDIVRENRKLNESIQGYLINSSRKAITNDPIILSQSPRPSSFAIDAALNGNEGSASYVNHNGMPVIGKYQWLDDLNVALIVELDEEAALSPARDLALNVAAIGILFSLALVVIVTLLARRITAPLLALTRTVTHISEGNFDASAPVLSNDEVGTLAQAFNNMTAKLRQTLAGLEKELNDRKQAEASLRQSEERYRNLFSGMQDGVYRSTHEGKFIDVNPALVKMFGYESREEMLAVDIKNELYFDPEDRDSVTVDHAQEIVDIFRMRRKDGSEIWVEDHWHYTFDENGNILYHEGLLRDITERIRAETALRENEQKFRTIFESSPIAICITTLEDGRMLEANYAYWDLMGYDPETSLGKTSDELKLWETPTERTEFVNKLKLKGSLYNPDDEFINEHGKEIQAISFYRLVKIGDEERIISMFYDMSIQKQTMQALQQSEARVRALLDTVPDMIMELNREGKIVNMIPPKGMEESMPPDQFTGKRIDEMLSEAASSQTLFALERTLATNHMTVFEFDETIGNAFRTLEARVVSNSSNTALMMVRDITQRKWVEQEREKLINELEIKNRESETLRESLASIVTKFDIQEVIERILDQIKNVIPYDTASVWQVDGEWQKLILGRDLPPEIPENLKFPIDADNSSRPIIRGEFPYILSNDVQEELLDFKGPHSYVHSWLAVPLKNRGEIIGLIALDGKTKGQFTKHHADLAVTFANQVAIALDNVSLFNNLQSELEQRRELIEELQTMNAEAETMRESLASIVGTFEFSEIIHRILDQIQMVVPYDSASIWRLEDGMQTLIGKRNLPSEVETEVETGFTFPVDDQNHAYKLFSGELPFIVSRDVQNEFPKFQQEPHTYINSWLGVPLKVRGKIIGLIALDGRRREQFNEHHAELAVTFADQVSIALENARLFSDLQTELAARKDLIAELESKNAELERFTYTVSHDLKSPLFTIRGFLGYLEHDALSGNHTRMKSDMQRITDATEKMQRLLNELLELSRIGRLRNELEWIPFTELTQDAVSLVQGRIMERGIAIHIDEGMPTVYGDRQRLLEVAQNLVDNAAKFMGDQPSPRIEIGWDGQDDETGMYIFHVRDNGIGIAPEHHERVFGLFNKLDVKADGTGIGLALVKRIVEVHGGRVWVQSEAGRGSTFFFTLPVSPPESKPTEK